MGLTPWESYVYRNPLFSINLRPPCGVRYSYQTRLSFYLKPIASVILKFDGLPANVSQFVHVQ